VNKAILSSLALGTLSFLLSCDRKSAGTPDSKATWNPAVTYGSLTDSRDGQVYRTVVVGNQTWMAQNLNFAGTDSAKVGVWYNNNPDSGAKYGRLYKWTEAMAIDRSYTKLTWGGSDLKHKGICPAGWHVPSDSEWTRLTDSTLAASKAGLQLKASGGWYSSGNGSGNGTDGSGFRALPAGNHGDAFDVAGNNAAFWSASEGFSDYAWFRILYNGSNFVYRFSSSKTYGFSVRCLQD
jgi:uncharacterized protein (TIGR02145 family)